MSPKKHKDSSSLIGIKIPKKYLSSSHHHGTLVKFHKFIQHVQNATMYKKMNHLKKLQI